MCPRIMVISHFSERKVIFLIFFSLGKVVCPVAWLLLTGVKALLLGSELDCSFRLPSTPFSGFSYIKSHMLSWGGRRRFGPEQRST
jgi:hypothetical protein